MAVWTLGVLQSPQSSRKEARTRAKGPSLVDMKNVYEVLRDKERAIVRLRLEVDALRLVAPLLADNTADPNEVSPEPQTDRVWTPTLQKNKWPTKVGNPAPNYSDS